MMRLASALLIAPASSLLASEIPRVNTYRNGDSCGGPSDVFPPPVLADCTEPIPAGVPDMRGFHVADMVRMGPIRVRLVERIEQCGMRVVVSSITPFGYSLVHDFPVANGSLASGCHDYMGGSFPECVAINVRGFYSANCLEMWADPSSETPEGGTPMTEETLGARRCLEGQTITFYNSELHEQLGRDLVYEPVSETSALTIIQASIQAQQRMRFVRIIPIVLIVLLVCCCCCCFGGCCYCKKNKKCCWATSTPADKPTGPTI